MIQFILMLVGVAFSGNTENRTTNNTQDRVMVQKINSNMIDIGEDTSGGSGQKPPFN